MASTTGSSFRVGIDIGGTFTDIVATGSDGEVYVRKVSSTPVDYSEGSCVGLASLLEEHRIRPDQVDVVVHATTMATNAVLEGKGARTGLITTAGFRDVLEFRRVRVPDLYNLDYVKPKPLVPRQLRREVHERMGPRGEIWVALDEASARRAACYLRDAGVTAVAVCLLHSYANPVHEKRIREIVLEVFADSVFVTCSHEILPEIREYERTSTTVVNAYLGPVMNRYLQTLMGRLEALGIGRSLHVMTSGGGQMSIRTAMTKPAYLVESGPAAGVIAAARIARRLDLPNIITLDMGGTTAKTAIVENAEPARTSEFEIGAGINLSSKLVNGAGYVIKLPFIDVSEIGAGGGSHIWFDKGGALKVGPQSAGAEPGPVCYGKGGEQVTVTDALLALGYINPDYLVGGAIRLAPDEARRAVAVQIAQRLGKPLAEAAHGALTIAVANMVRAVKSVSTYRGRDPREYTLIAFGGNGPIVATAIARELAMTRVLVPPNSGVLSAHGLLVADHEQVLVKSFPGRLSELGAEGFQQAFDVLIKAAVDALQSEGFARGQIEIHRHADLRYVGQAFELTVPVAGDAIPDLALLTQAFHDEHLRTYSHMAPGEPVEAVNIRVVAKVPTRAPQVRKADSRVIATGGATAAPRTREVYFGPSPGWRTTPVLRRADLIGASVAGPLVVEEYDSTCVVPPDAKAKVDQWNNLVIVLES